MSLDKIKEIEGQIEFLQIKREEIFKSIKPTDEELEIFYEFAKKEISKNINNGSDNECDIFVDLQSNYSDKLIRLEVYSLSKSHIINLFFNHIGGDIEEANAKYSRFIINNDVMPINSSSIYLFSSQIFYTSNICDLISTLNLDINKININSFVKNYSLIKEKIKFIESNEGLLRLIDLSIFE